MDHSASYARRLVLDSKYSEDPKLMKHGAEGATLSLGVLLMCLSGIRLMKPVAEPPWGDWLFLVIGALVIIASIIRLTRKDD